MAKPNRAALARLVTDDGLLDILDAWLLAGAPREYDAPRNSAVEVAPGRHTFAVAGLDDLIRVKRATGREQDFADIRALTRSDEEPEREAREST